MATSSVQKWFSIFQYQQEADFLSQQHRQGKVFQEHDGYTYEFQVGPPQDMTYQILYLNYLDDKEAHLQMMEDKVWQYIDDFDSFSYFRKANDCLSDVDRKLPPMVDPLSHIDAIMNQLLFPKMGYTLLFYGLIYDQSTTFNIIISITFLIFVVMYFDYYHHRRKIANQVSQHPEEV